MGVRGREWPESADLQEKSAPEPEAETGSFQAREVDARLESGDSLPHFATVSGPVVSLAFGLPSSVPPSTPDPLPQVDIPEATALGRRLEAATGGFLGSLLTETLFGIPTTAHILGGCVMGDSPETGVIGPNHEVWNYPGLYVMDGSTVSANPGVNPSLTIAAMAERAVGAIE